MKAAVRKAPGAGRAKKARRAIKGTKAQGATKGRNAHRTTKGTKAQGATGGRNASVASKAGSIRSEKKVICVKRHCTGHEFLIAACDEALLGKCFVDGDIRLDVCNSFYEGEKMDVRLFLETLSLATIANLVGKDAVSAAIEAGFVDPSCVIRIKGVPHAQLFRL
jgi:hypothetical protein